MIRHRGERGVVLVVVLFFALLLTSSTATFLRRAVVDSRIILNRDRAAQAEALARGGVSLATALLLEDRLREVDARTGEVLAVESLEDVWAQVANQEFEAPGNGTLRLRIEDTGARLNLNALFLEGEPLDDATELLLRALLEKIIEEMPGRPEEKLYDPAELARNLIDYIDEDDVKQVSGDQEDDYYLSQDPPYRAGNRPLLSVTELALVEGFDARLRDAMAPYVTVYPLVGGEGINLNTASTWVLSALYYNDGVDHRLADEDTVRQVLKVRERGDVFCPRGQDSDGCTPVSEVFLGNEPFPPPPSKGSEVFTVVSEARVGDIRRIVEAVIDRSDPREPVIWSWRVR